MKVGRTSTGALQRGAAGHGTANVDSLHGVATGGLLAHMQSPSCAYAIHQTDGTMRLIFPVPRSRYTCRCAPSPRSWPPRRGRNTGSTRASAVGKGATHSQQGCAAGVRLTVWAPGLEALPLLQSAGSPSRRQDCASATWCSCVTGHRSRRSAPGGPPPRLCCWPRLVEAPPPCVTTAHAAPPLCGAGRPQQTGAAAAAAAVAAARLVKRKTWA